MGNTMPLSIFVFDPDFYGFLAVNSKIRKSYRTIIFAENQCLEVFRHGEHESEFDSKKI